MKRILILILCAGCAVPAFAANKKKPRLVVNIVVSGMRYDYLLRFGNNFMDGGFRRFMSRGMVFTDAHYNFAQTTTGAGLATLTTGAQPSLHGVVSTRWTDYVNNKAVLLIGDGSVRGLNCDDGIGQYSNVNITVPTLGDRLKEEQPHSKVITLAPDPVSAIVMGGQLSDVYWMDKGRGKWVTSTAYKQRLPQWVNDFNYIGYADFYAKVKWELSRHEDTYVNTDYTIANGIPAGRFRKVRIDRDIEQKFSSKENYARILDMPMGNTMVKEFAKQAIIYEELGRDRFTDVLNICFDTPRYVTELFGPSSVELEDMYYRLDADIAELINFIFSQVPEDEVLIVLTSDHGTSDSYNGYEMERDRFNVDQFKMIVNVFMNAQWGDGDWVVDFVDRQLYLNRNLVYVNGLSLAEVHSRVAAFVLQFRGVSHVLTATALTGSYFGSGYAQKMQNSFYPRRSGDLMIALMPGWIIEQPKVRSESGSMYGYDTHVPLIMLGAGLPGGKIDTMTDMTSVAATLARIMDISRPIAAEGAPIMRITENFDYEER